MKEFKLNEYITLKFEANRTKIYVGDIYFSDYNPPQIKELIQEDILYLDDKFNRINYSKEISKINQENAYQRHCNLFKTWFDNEYDPQILPINLAFPLLIELITVGNSERMFNLRYLTLKCLESGNSKIISYIIRQDYIKYIDLKDLFSLTVHNSNSFIRILSYFELISRSYNITIVSKSFDGIKRVTEGYNYPHYFTYKEEDLLNELKIEIIDSVNKELYKEYDDFFEFLFYGLFKIRKSLVQLLADDDNQDIIINIILRKSIIDLNWSFFEAVNYLGLTFLDLNEFKKAKEAFMISIKINPNGFNSFFLMGEIYFKQGDYEKALINFEESSKNREEDSTYYLVSNRIKNLKDFLSKLIPNDLNSEIIDVLFKLINSYLYWEYAKDLLNFLLNIRGILDENGRHDLKEYIMEKIQFYLINFNFSDIKILFDVITSKFEEKDYLQIYEKIGTVFINKLEHEAFKVYNRKAIDVLMKLGKYSLNSLIKIFSKYGDDEALGFGDHFSKFQDQIVIPIKNIISNSLKKKSIGSIYPFIDHDFISRLEKETILNIFWEKETKFLQKIIDLVIKIYGKKKSKTLRSNLVDFDLMNIIKVIGREAYPLAANILRLPLGVELDDTIVWMKEMVPDIIENLKLVFAEALNNKMTTNYHLLAFFLILINHFEENELLDMIINNNLIEITIKFENQYCYYDFLQYSPVEYLKTHFPRIFKQKILNEFINSDYDGIAELFKLYDCCEFIRFLDTTDWMNILDNSKVDFFHILLKVQEKLRRSGALKSSYIYDNLANKFVLPLKSILERKIIEHIKKENLKVVVFIFKTFPGRFISEENLLSLIRTHFKFFLIVSMKSMSFFILNKLKEILISNIELFSKDIYDIIGEKSKFQLEITQYLSREGILNMLDVNKLNSISNRIEEIKKETPQNEILLIEADHPTIRLITSYVEGKGHTCKGIMTGKKDWEELENSLPPIFILLDILLPDLSGYDLCKKIKSDPRFSKIPVYFLTAIPGPEVDKKLPESKADGYILKPFDLSELCDIIFDKL